MPEKYEFKLISLEGKLEKNGWHCFFTEPSEGKAATVYEILKKQIRQLDHIHLVGGLMDNIHVKGQKGAQEWSDHVSPLVSFDNKEEALANQIFYFTVENNKILPSNQL